MIWTLIVSIRPAQALAAIQTLKDWEEQQDDSIQQGAKQVKEVEDESLQFQRKNIEFLIHYYENGGKVPPPGQSMWLLDGKVVDKMPEKISEGSAMWLEVVCLPLTLTYSICSLLIYT